MKHLLITMTMIMILSGVVHAQNWFDVPFVEYQIDANDCSGFLYKQSGSRIYIPQNAFVLDQNRAVCPQITIKYREVHTPLEILLTQTSMKYNNQYLESGGMFEIYAECNGKPLKLAKNKRIEVQFATKNNLSGLETFILSKNKETWKKIAVPVNNYGVRSSSDSESDLWGSPAVPSFEQREYWDEWDGETDFDWEEESDYREYKTKENQVFKSMKIDQMGMYNYDRILKEESRIPILADFKIKGMDANLNKIYVAYEGINSLLYFVRTDWTTNFALLADQNYKLFAIATDGRVAVLTEADKLKLKISEMKDQTHTFELVLQEQQPQNPEQLALLTGLKQ